MNKTILILSHQIPNHELFCSYVYNHAESLAKMGNKVIVFAITNYFPFIKPKKKMKNVIVNGVDIRYYNTIGFSNFLFNSKINLNAYSYYKTAKKKLKRILKTEKIDLIDAHMFKIEGYAAALLKKKFDIPVIVTLHGTSFNRCFMTKNGREQIKYVAKIIDNYVCVSDKIYNQLETLNIKNKKIIYNGIKPLKIKRTNELYNICTVGNLISSKNIDVLLKAFAPIAKKYKKAKMFIIGDGPLKKELIDLTNNLEINKQVEFLGRLKSEEIFKYLSKSNIFCLLSKPEGFGIVYLEAMYCGCITIGTKKEGIDGFIQDSINGYLLNVNEKELTDKFEFILNNNCDIIRNSGIESAKSQTWDKNAQDYMALMFGGESNG